MNKIVNKFLLAGNKFMPNSIENSQDLLKVVLDRLLNIVKGFKNSEEKMILIYIYKNKFCSCFAHNVVYADSKNLAKKTVSHKVVYINQ